MSNDYRSMVHAYRHKIMVGPKRTSVDAIPDGATEVELDREKKSHAGIGALTQIRKLAAIDVNQAYLDEIGNLENLTHLDLRWPVRAKDIAPLAKLQKLEVLHFETASGIEDFSPLLDLPRLKVLTIENAPKVRSLEWMRPLKDRLTVFGYEGSINKDQIVESIAPLEGFAIEAFFCTSLSNQSKDLKALATCPNLKLVKGAVLAPWAQYKWLKERKPDLACSWYDPNNWYAGWRDGPSAEEREAAQGEG